MLLFPLILTTHFALAAVTVLPLKGVPCKRQIANTISQFNMHATWQRMSPPGAAVTVFQSPSGTVGELLRVSIEKDNTARLTRTTPHTRTEMVWDKETCVPKVSATPIKYDETQLKQAFTDDDLQNLLKSEQAGVIYLWSPQMPYSIVGIDAIREATKRLGISLTFLLDPNCDMPSALAEGKKKQLQNKDFRKVESLELLSRNVTVHFPSVLVFSKGRITSPLFPGVKKTDTYETFIKEYLR